MSKSPQAFRTISEVSEAIDVPAHVLRFWESRFTQVKPVKRGGGRRYYRPEDIALLKVIRALLYTEGLTIRGVQKMLRETGQKALVERYSDASFSVEDIATPQNGHDAADSSAPTGAASSSAGEDHSDKTAERQAALKSVLFRLEKLREEMSSSVPE